DTPPRARGLTRELDACVPPSGGGSVGEVKASASTPWSATAAGGSPDPFRGPIRDDADLHDLLGGLALRQGPRRRARRDAAPPRLGRVERGHEPRPLED